MRMHRNKLWRALALGALPLLVAAACLLVPEQGVRTIGLSALAEQESGPLMSCASEDLSSGEPMWCANPDSPHCVPALPEPARAELGHGPSATLWSALQPAPHVSVGVDMPCPALEPQRVLSTQLSFALERPPRLS